MAIKVKSAEEVARKWAEVTPQRSAYLESGLMGSGTTWEAETANAAGAYRAAVTAPNIEAMFRGGVKKAGGAKFERKAIQVGVGRYGAGVQAAQEDMKSGIEPMLSTISSLTLSPRAPRGSDTNYRRVQEVGTALHKKRLALRAAGA
jgi:hypothetical protein